MPEPNRLRERRGMSRSSSELSPIWQKAIDRYYAELRKGGIKDITIDKDLWNIESPNDLLKYIQSHTPAGNHSAGSWSRTLLRLEPILLSLNDFATVISWAMGMDGRVAAVIWGSMRLIVKFAQPVLPQVVDMLEDLERILPRFRKYEEELPMTDTLEDALADVYTEIIVFCAHAITFFRNNPNVGRSRTAWSQFSADFSKVISGLRSYSRRVDEAADLIRLSRETQATETIKAIQNLQTMKISGAKVPCFVIPYGLNLRFFGRLSEMEVLRKKLDPHLGGEKLRVFAIHGLGENQIKLAHALSDLADKLELPKSEGADDDYRSVQKVRDWLNTTAHSFLLIFDNVERADILDQIWPSCESGSIILTTRSPAVASRRATDVMHLECFTGEVGLEALYSLTRKWPGNEEEIAAAKELSQLLGGLPLAIIQISEFIYERGYTYEEFLKVYQKSAQKVLARSEVPVEYNHTISTVWDISLQKQSEDSGNLLNLLSFFDPDVVPEWILTNTKIDPTDDRLEFLHDEFDFREAIVELTRASLVNRISELKALSTHRLVQFAVFIRLQPEEKTFFLDTTIRMLFFGFPNTWKQTGHQQGHGFNSWETASAILPHVHSLMKLVEKHKLKASDTEQFAELIFRCGTYLWEKEQPTMARHFIQYGLNLPLNDQTRNYAQACRLLGHVALDMAQPRAALAAYQKALAARQRLEEPQSPPIADIYDSIACSYTEFGDVTSAFDYLSKATEIHQAHDPGRMGRTQAIYALTYLRDSQYEQSLTALMECWRSQGLTETDIAASKYPKHSGDIMLLARLRFGQDRRDDAQHLVSRALLMRRGLFGDRGPRVADSLFHLARLLLANGKPDLAGKLYRETVEMSQGFVEMRGHKARALWFLANVESGEVEVDELRERARVERKHISDREVKDEDTDEAFMGLVGWMLW